MHKTHTYTACTCMHVKTFSHFILSNEHCLISAFVCALTDLQVVVVAVGVHLVAGVYVEH